MVNDKHFLHLVGEAEVMKAEIAEHDVHLDNLSDDLRRLQIKADRIESTLEERFTRIDQQIQQLHNIVEYLVKLVKEQKE